MARLDARLEAAGSVGDGWRAFLRWDTLNGQLTGDVPPDLATLDAIYADFNSGHPGLNLVWFADVRVALRRYLGTARAMDNPRIQAQYDALLDRLPARLQAYHDNPTADDALWLSMALAGLEDAGQAEGLVRSIRRCFSSPNLFFRVSADVIRAGLERSVDETQPVRDVILGSDVYGTGHLTGQLAVELAPATDQARLDMVLRGTIESDAVGYKGPARVYTDGTTQMASRKSVLLDVDHVWSLPATSHAVTDSTITNVRTRFGCRLVERIAWRRAHERHPEAQKIGSRHAERRVNRRLDKEAGQLVDKLNGLLWEKFRRPLVERRLFPQLFRVNTTETALCVTALHGGRSGMGTANVPPALPGEPDLAICLHESMVNNFASAALAGMIVEEQRLGDQVGRLLGSRPKWLEPDEENEPWGITFTQRQPISVAFADDQFAVTVRGRRYARGDRHYTGMNVTAVYAIRKTGEAYRAVRQGELEIFPPNFEPGRDTLSASQQVLRTLLRKKLGRLFTREIVPKDLALPGRWKDAGRLSLAHWGASDGWMVLAWKWIPRAGGVDVRPQIAVAP